jgi:hypothetical protein
MSRAGRRSMGKREARRKCRATVERIIELDERGLSPLAIASSVGLDEEFVYLVLDHANEAREVLEGGGA